MVNQVICTSSEVKDKIPTSFQLSSLFLSKNCLARWFVLPPPISDRSGSQRLGKSPATTAGIFPARGISLEVVLWVNFRVRPAYKNVAHNFGSLSDQHSGLAELVK